MIFTDNLLCLEAPNHTSIRVFQTQARLNEQATLERTIRFTILFGFYKQYKWPEVRQRLHDAELYV